MQLNKKQNDALSGKVGPNDLAQVKELIGEDGVLGWSVFDPSGIEVVSQGVSETATAVCSNALDMAMMVGTDLGEEPITPSITFLKGSSEMKTTTLDDMFLVVVRDKSAGRKG